MMISITQRDSLEALSDTLNQTIKQLIILIYLKIKVTFHHLQILHKK